MTLETGSPTDNLHAISDLIWETDPEMCEFVFGGKNTWRQNCEAEWQQDFGLHSCTAARVAKAEGQPVGLLIAFPESEMLPRYAATVSRYETAIGQRMAAVGWLFPVLPENALYIFNFAVSESHRGQKLGSRLLSAVEEDARRKGIRTIHLDVACDTPAVGFYGHMGYQKLTQTRLLQPATNIPAHFRMFKEL